MYNCTGLDLVIISPLFSGAAYKRVSLTKYAKTAANVNKMRKYCRNVRSKNLYVNFIM